jgi:hypothetical protein
VRNPTDPGWTLLPAYYEELCSLDEGVWTIVIQPAMTRHWAPHTAGSTTPSDPVRQAQALHLLEFANVVGHQDQPLATRMGALRPDPGPARAGGRPAGAYEMMIGGAAFPAKGKTSSRAVKCSMARRFSDRRADFSAP